MQTFQAVVVDQLNGSLRAETRSISLEDLPEGELLIQVAYSSINYKDALAMTPNGNIVKRYPFIPGIDLAGTVVDSRDGRFRQGDEVIVTGYELGVSHDGGLSQYARVPANWAVPLPLGLTMKEAMIFGTAGFTAALSVLALQKNGTAPGQGSVLVTGATGGVGSMSVAMLSRLGYDTVASTGKPEMEEQLIQWGASRVISREELIPQTPRPLNKQLWAGAIDCVGGKTLASLLSSIRYGGVVAACGLTGGSELTMTVFPFILRAIRLIGIDSVYVPMDLRQNVWNELAGKLKPDTLEGMYTEITLEQVIDAAGQLLEGQAKGRIIVRTSQGLD